MQSTLDTEKLRKELHDGIGRILSNIAMLGFYGRMQEDPAASRETFSKIAELASEGIAGLRGLVNNLDSGESGGLDTLIGMPEQDPPVFDPINRRPSIRLAIVEDDQVTRDTLSLILTRSPAISACEAYVSAEDALASLSADCPDILLVDLELPGMSGIELIEKVKQEYPSIDIMVHTIFEDSPTVFAAIKAGASGYILKDSCPDELIESLGILRLGGAPMSPRIAHKVILEFQQSLSAIGNLLSPREEKILRCIEQGLSYNEVAERLGISYHTVHTHIKKIYEKLQASGRRDALRRARNIGIL